MSTMERVLYPDTATVEALLKIWEASVRATHDFLSEKDIVDLRPDVKEAFLIMDHLYCAKEGSGIVGFMGVKDKKIEMLFIAPSVRGKGIGKDLVTFALSALKVDAVDVNEQNPQAVGFYERMGFHMASRSELDEQGRPFPILHMEFNN